MSEDTHKEYWDNVAGIAESVLDDYPADFDQSDAVHESVDGSYWIIYTHAQRKVLEFTDFDYDAQGSEIAAMSDGSFSNMQTVAAYLSLESDVWSAIRTLEDERADDEVEDA